MCTCVPNVCTISLHAANKTDLCNTAIDVRCDVCVCARASSTCCFDNINIIPLICSCKLANDNVSSVNAQSCNIGFAVGINMMIHDDST